MHVHFSVDYRAPYALRFHVEGPYAQRSFWLDDLPVVVRLSQREPDGPLLADVYSDRSIDERSAALRAAVRHMVAADDDLHDFSVAVARDLATHFGDGAAHKISQSLLQWQHYLTEKSQALAQMGGELLQDELRVSPDKTELALFSSAVSELAARTDVLQQQLAACRES